MSYFHTGERGYHRAWDSRCLKYRCGAIAVGRWRQICTEGAQAPKHAANNKPSWHAPLRGHCARAPLPRPRTSRLRPHQLRAHLLAHCARAVRSPARLPRLRRSNWETLRYLLSNLKYWMVEYK